MAVAIVLRRRVIAPEVMVSASNTHRHRIAVEQQAKRPSRRLSRHIGSSAFAGGLPQAGLRRHCDFELVAIAVSDVKQPPITSGPHSGSLRRQAGQSSRRRRLRSRDAPSLRCTIWKSKDDRRLGSSATAPSSVVEDHSAN
jgi:hypothetical protein